MDRFDMSLYMLTLARRGEKVIKVIKGTVLSDVPSGCGRKVGSGRPSKEM
jgi:hypothetical protein